MEKHPSVLARYLYDSSQESGIRSRNARNFLTVRSHDVRNLSLPEESAETGVPRGDRHDPVPVVFHHRVRSTERNRHGGHIRQFRAGADIFAASCGTVRARGG